MQARRERATSTRRTADGPLFRQGFGDRSRIEAILDTVASYDAHRPPLPIEVTTDRSLLSLLGPRVVQLTFRSPGACWIPEECHTARVELVLPPDIERPPVCLMLPATAEETFALRRLLAAPLIGRGIGVAILETPFYGRRRPTGQLGPLIRTVSDQLGLNLATLEEARSLLHYLCAEGYGALGVTGYSQGGIMAAFTAALMPFPVAAVPRAAPATATSLVVHGPIRRALCWTRLAADLGGLDAAERFLADVLEPMRVDAFPPPVAASCAIVVTARDDRLIPPEHGLALHRHWEGSELRTVEGGNFTALFRARDQIEAIYDAFVRLSSFVSGRDGPIVGAA